MDDLSANILTKKTIYPDQYDPNVLKAINRDQHRVSINIDVHDLPFQGLDIWNEFDFTWLNSRGSPEYGMLTIYIPCNSTNLVEAKTLKLYLFSFANSQFHSMQEIVATIQQDLSNVTKAPIKAMLGPTLPDFMHVVAHLPGTSLDGLPVKINDYDVNPELLTSDPKEVISEQLCSDLLKFNCVVTGKPNIGSIRINYTGPKLDQTGLLRYLISYQNHSGYHEHLIEKIFVDIFKLCKPSELTVEGRFTRRGGIDINPVRSNMSIGHNNTRLFRQ